MGNILCKDNGFAFLAQSVERAPFKRVVVGSSPTESTITK
jgi:hypothetical protein